MNFEVVGSNYRQADFERAQLKPGDALSLRPDPDNPYDSLAIKVLKNNIHIGYVPRHLTPEVAQIMQGPGRITVETAWSKGCTVILEAGVVKPE